MFEKISELRTRLRSIGAPSEQALYARTSSAPARQPMMMPDSARARSKTVPNLQHDSAAIIRDKIYSGSRF